MMMMMKMVMMAVVLMVCVCLRWGVLPSGFNIIHKEQRSNPNKIVSKSYFNVYILYV